MSRPAPALAVHLLTASGAALALLALLAAGRGDWPVMFLWLLAALLVDGVDGPLARRADVAHNAPRWNGVLMDLIIDYLTYVLIPAYALVEAALIGPGWSLAAGLMICLTGVVYFADTRMKTSDKSFLGFPGCWNMVILVLFTVDIGEWGGMLVLIAIAALQFAPLKFVHPVRTRRWRPVSFVAMAAWSGAAIWSAWVGFAPPAAVTAVLLVTSAYLFFAGMAQQVLPAGAARRAVRVK